MRFVWTERITWLCSAQREAFALCAKQALHASHYGWTWKKTSCEDVSHCGACPFLSLAHFGLVFSSLVMTLNRFYCEICADCL
mmetsp:Transcript_3626/g.4626  ORF Transcript_3626/g.4626 Transcript_3626/m.4626 type:complete len:83 (-) Transcript_3626:769-1017(-)